VDDEEWMLEGGVGAERWVELGRPARRGWVAERSWRSGGDGVAVMMAVALVVTAASSGMEEEEWIPKKAVGAERWEESGRMEGRGRMAAGSRKREGEGVAVVSW